MSFKRICQSVQPSATYIVPEHHVLLPEVGARWDVRSHFVLKGYSAQSWYVISCKHDLILKLEAFGTEQDLLYTNLEICCRPAIQHHYLTDVSRRCSFGICDTGELMDSSVA